MGNVITGTDLTIDVGKNYKGKLNIYGKTEQETRSGKNLLIDNYTMIPKGTTPPTVTVLTGQDTPKGLGIVRKVVFPANNNAEFFTGCRVQSNDVMILDDGNNNFTVSYRVWVKTSMVYNEEYVVYVTGAMGTMNGVRNEANDYKDWQCYEINGFKHNVPGYSSINEYLSVFARNTSTEERTIEVAEAQINEGYLEEWESYGASPTPEFPSEIENVEGKNKFSGFVKGIRLNSSSGLEYSNETGATSDYISVDFNINPNYYLSGLTDSLRSYIAAYNAEKKFLGRTSAMRRTSELLDKTIFTAETTQATGDIAFIRVTLHEHTELSGTIDDVDNLKTQIEKGTVATEYVPYNSIGVKVTGKNLWNNETFATNMSSNIYEKTENGFIFNRGESTGGKWVSQNINLKAGETITFSYMKEGVNTSLYLYESYVYGTVIKNSVGTSLTYTADKDILIVCTIIINSNCNSLIADNIQIEKSTVATEYEPYKEQTVYFPLAEGQKLMEGSYLADDGIHNVRKQVVLDGTEVWSNQEAKYDTENRMFFASKLSSKINADLVDRKGLCNYFKNAKGVQSSNNDITAFQFNNLEQHSNYIYFKIEKSELETLDVQGWVKWLGEHKPVVEYELAEEEIIPYTEEQQEAWNEIQNIYLFEGKNYFNNLNAVKPKLNLTYLKIVEDDTEFYISENGRLVIPEYDISYLIDFNASNIPSMPEAMEAVVKVVGKDGDIYLNTTYEAMSFSIVCYTDDNLTPEEKVREEQKVNRFMNSIKNDTKILGFEIENKFYDVKYSGALTTIRFPAHLQFTIPIKSSESYAKDLIKKSIKGNGFENSETIKDVGAIFTIKGPAQTPKISFNNYEIFYDNVLLENTELVIDSSNSTVTHINNVTGLKTNAMRYYNHQFPKVRYGENVLSVNSGIDDASQVKVEWNDLKL